MHKTHTPIYIHTYIHLSVGQSRSLCFSPYSYFRLIFPSHHTHLPLFLLLSPQLSSSYSVHTGFNVLLCITPQNQRTSLSMAVYSPAQGILAQITEERDACGVGFIASLSNKASHSILKQALEACSCMEHRGASSADNISGDGAGVLTGIPWKLLKDIIDPNKHKNKDGSPGCAISMVSLSSFFISFFFLFLCLNFSLNFILYLSLV